MANKKLKTLKSLSEFVELKKKGKRLFVEPWLQAVYRKSNDFKVGISIRSSDAIAVKRNRLKRWVKEFFRKNQIEGYEVLLIFKNKQFELDQVTFKSFQAAALKINAQLKPQ